MDKIYTGTLLTDSGMRAVLATITIHLGPTDRVQDAESAIARINKGLRLERMKFVEKKEEGEGEGEG